MSIKKHQIRKDILAFLGGALLPLAFAPFNIWPLAVLLFAFLLWLWIDVTPCQAARLGGLFGLGTFLIGISWVYISLYDYGGASSTFAALATITLTILMSLYFAAAGFLLTYLAPSSGIAKWLLLAPTIWAGLEWVRSWLFTGFPWLALGYSQIDSPLVSFAPYMGIFGISWAVAISSGLIVLSIEREKMNRLIWITLFVFLWFCGWMLGQVNWVSHTGDTLRVSLVQGNISQDKKWLPNFLNDTLQIYTDLSSTVTAESDLIIWPETAIPAFYQEVDFFVQALDERARSNGISFLIGIPFNFQETNAFYNSVISLGNSHDSIYHKRRLLPFGEYLPLRFLFNFFHDFVDIPMSDFTSGQRNQPLPQIDGNAIGISICFEAVFGNEIRISLPEAKFLVNVSNDSWFGNSLAPYQHLQIVRMRALEMGRYIARGTNTGITAIIDNKGNILKQSELFNTEVMQGDIKLFEGATPYVKMGDAPAIAIFGILFLSGIILKSLTNNSIK